MSITIRDGVTGEPRVIENPLLPEHVEVGRLLWYDGFTSTFGWSCPAIITQVNCEEQLFRVRSLDDMAEQSQWYHFDTANDCSGSRETMRLVEPPVVRAYLEERRLALEEEVLLAKTRLQKAEANLKQFTDVLATLNI